MKRLNFDSNNAHIAKISVNSDEAKGEKSGFDLVKLLQILPKLNLGGIFQKENSGKNDGFDSKNRVFDPQLTSQNNLNGEFVQTQDIMAQQNVALAKTALENHANIINKLRK